MYEVYLTKKQISEEEWQTLIAKLVRVHNYGQKIELDLTFDGPEVRIFLKTPREVMNYVADVEGLTLSQTSEKPRELMATPSIKPIILQKNDNLNILIEKLRALGQELVNLSLVVRKIPSGYSLKAYAIYERAGSYRIARVRDFKMNFLRVDFRKSFLLKKAPKYLDLVRTTGLISGKSAGALISLNVFPYFKGQHYVTLSSYDFNKHTVVFGASGGGKTKFLSQMVSEIAQKYGEAYHVLVIDPHDAMREEIGGLPDTKVYDYRSSETGMDLFMTSEQDIVSSVEMTLNLFKSLIGAEWNSRLERLLRASVYLLTMKNELDLQNLRRVLIDITFKNASVKDVADYLPESLQEFFGQDYNELKTRHYDETFARILAFIDELQLTPAFYRKNAKRLDYELMKNKVTLVSLSQARLGEKAVRTLAGLIMNQLFMLGMERKITQRVILVVDETAIVENLVLARMLSEARKYDITVILAGQYFAQVSDKLREAIFANVANYWCFRLNYSDAEELVRHLEMNLIDAEKTDLIATSSDKASLSEKIRFLADLPERQVVARLSRNGVTLPAVMGRSVDFVACPEQGSFAQEELKLTPALASAKKSGRSLVKQKASVSILDLMREQSTSRKKIS